MKVAILMKIARQVEGEFVFVSVDKANTNVSKIREYLMDNELPRTEKVGDVDCVLEYGIIEVDVEEG